MFIQKFGLAVLTVAVLSAQSSPQSDPFRSPAPAKVLLFLRTDCPLTERYAPELKRIASEFGPRHVEFWLVYPDRSESRKTIEDHVKRYGLPGTTVSDPSGEIVRRAHATVAPEAAVFDSRGNLVYHGRIDNWWVDFGKVRASATVHDLENAITSVLADKQVTISQTRAIGCSLADVQ